MARNALKTWSILSAVLFAGFLAAQAWAINYNVLVSWTDTTVVQPGETYTAGFDLEYRINGGTETLVSGLTSPTWSTQLNLTPGDTLEVRYRALNTAAEPDLVSNWTPWYGGVAQAVYTMPGVPGSPTIQIIVP